MENSEATKKCIYCREEKSESEFTLEHLIPQFLGGAQAPQQFKSRDVCGRCNSNLGLFVDAGFEKNWFVSNNLRQSAYSFFDPTKPVGLPLICMGISGLLPPQVQEGEICESWLGPLGEQVYWVRPHDERLYWYAGGNPRTTKKMESRAYYLFSERSTKNPLLTWLSFRDSFEGRRVKKIMCTEVDGADPKDIGFSDPDDLDNLRIEYFKNTCANGQVHHNQLSIYTQFDFRFLAKLGLGVAYALFGGKALKTPYAEELYKALWYRNEDEQPLVNGTSSLVHNPDPGFSQLTGEESAVTVTIVKSSPGVAVNLNLGTSLNWTVMCANYDNLDAEDLERLGDGLVIVLYRNLQRGVSLTLPEYLAHKCGVAPHPELAQVTAIANLHRDYFKNL